MKKKISRNPLKEPGMQCTHEIPGQNDDDGLPEGWGNSSLHDLASFMLGGDWGIEVNQATKEHTVVRVIRGTDYKNWNEQRASNAAERAVKNSSLEKRRLRLGDIVVEVSGGGPSQPVGRTVLIDEIAVNSVSFPLVCSNFFRLLRLHETADPAYVNYYLNFAIRRGDFDKFQTQTTNLRNLNFTEFLENTIVPLPPLSEQRRIVSKLDELLGKVTSARQRLDKLPTLLKRFRQSVLAAACSGKLTEDWREENDREVDDSSDSGLPTTWTRSRVEDIIDGLKYGTSKKCDYATKGTPVLRIPNVSDGVIDHGDLKYAKLDTREFEQLRLQAGDILMIRSNGSVSLVGKTALVRSTEQNFAYAGYLIRIRPDRACIAPEYLNHVFDSYDIRLQIELNARSTSGVNNINSDEVRALETPLPPLAEQREIVKRVEQLFSFADRIESRLSVAQASVEKLTQSILAKAFSGQLVATDAELGPEKSTGIAMTHGASESMRRVVDVFREFSEGRSSDLVVVSPEINAEFIRAVHAAGIRDSAFHINRTLLNARKRRLLSGIKTSIFHRVEGDGNFYEFAGEWALFALKNELQRETGQEFSLDMILCHPDYAERFDHLAARFNATMTPLDFRWLALRLRKRSPKEPSSRARAASQTLPGMEDFVLHPAWYSIRLNSDCYYVNGTSDFHRQKSIHLESTGGDVIPSWIIDRVAGNCQFAVIDNSTYDKEFPKAKLVFRNSG